MRFVFLISLYFFLFFSSCKKTERNASLQIFRYNESNGINSLDPAFANDKASIWVCSQIFSTLVKMDDSMNVSPLIAKDWSILDSGRTYKFILRDDIYFHDHDVFIDGKGRKVIASDFVFSFNRLLDSEISSPGAWTLNNVLEFYAIDDSTFVINLKDPFVPFISMLSMQYFSVVPYEYANNTKFRSHPIGTGPFKFQYWKEGVKLVLRKNSNYFEYDKDIRLPYLDAISITFAKDKQSEFLSFLHGDLDMISGIDISYKDELLNRDGTLKSKYRDKIEMQILPFLNTEYLAFNIDADSEFSRNSNLRKAMSLAIDKDKMIKYLRNNVGYKGVFGFVPIGLNSYFDSLDIFEYDLDKSKQFLTSSGYPNGKGLDPIILNTTDAYIDLSEYIQHELKKIGINIIIEVNPTSTHRELVNKGMVDLYRASWIADYPDPENYLALFYSGDNFNNGLNKTHFSNKQYDSLYLSSIQEENVALRNNMYRIMDKIIIDSAVVIPLYYDQIVRFFQKNISNLTVNSQNSLDLVKVVKRD